MSALGALGAPPQAEMLTVQREVEAWIRILSGRQAERTVLQGDLRQWQERATHLKQHTIPSL
jgi:hypothetical protein